jgi:hypothetical protein
MLPSLSGNQDQGGHRVYHQRDTSLPDLPSPALPESWVLLVLDEFHLAGQLLHLVLISGPCLAVFLHQPVEHIIFIYTFFLRDREVN